VAVEAGYLAVARFAKPHGLKGEAIVFVLTDRPDEVFVEGRRLVPVDESGRAVGTALMIERARPYHRRWLLKFEGIDQRTPLERWGQVALGIPPGELGPPAHGGLAAHEVAGAAVVQRGERVGTALGLVPVPGGMLLVVEVDGREVLVPFRPPILVGVDRDRREIAIDPPPGLLEL
jgi:16S rRNA processing protein RimM